MCDIYKMYTEMQSLQASIHLRAYDIEGVLGRLSDWEQQLRTMYRKQTGPTLVQEVEARVRAQDRDKRKARAMLDVDRRATVLAAARIMVECGLERVTPCFETDRWDANAHYRGHKFTVGSFHDGRVAFLGPFIEARAWETLSPDLRELPDKIATWVEKCARLPGSGL
jgi:hypothetical protein